MSVKKTGMKEFGEWLKFILEEQGIRQNRLAEELGLNKRTITRYLSNDTCPDVDIMMKILDRFGYHIAFKKNKPWEDK